MNCVEFRDVQLSVDGTCYLRGADLSVAAGESVVIAGLPGCGKSFVPRLILGLPGLDEDRVELQGQVCVSGENVPLLNSQELQLLRRRIGSVMRDGGLVENMDIRANVSLPLTYHYRDVLGPEDIQRRCDLLLADFQLEHLGAPGIRPVAIHRRERLYASLARALVCEPFLLLLDEPCAGLDPGSARRLREHVFTYEPLFEPALLQRRVALTRIVATADLGRYLDVADRFVLLWEGQLESIGDRTAVLASDDARVRQLLDTGPGVMVPAAMEPAHG